MQTIDCRGLNCPRPVMEAKKALEAVSGGEIRVLVDNAAAEENVRRFAESQGWRVQVTPEKDFFALQITKGEAETQPSLPEREKGLRLVPRQVVFLDSDVLGRGPEELGRILLRSFLYVLTETEAPETVILINTGVKLACDGSEALESLSALAQRGVQVLSCGTCLDYFHLKSKVRVGRIANMFEILEILRRARQVIKA